MRNVHPDCVLAVKVSGIFLQEIEIDVRLSNSASKTPTVEWWGNHRAQVTVKLLALIMPGTRSQSENMDGKLGAKSAPVDHSYMRSDRSKPSTPSMKALENVFEKCGGV